jgi:hypothetical protein
LHWWIHANLGMAPLSTDLARTSMHPAAKPDLHSLELRNHPLLRHDMPDGESIGLVAPPTVVSEA